MISKLHYLKLLVYIIEAKLLSKLAKITKSTTFDNIPYGLYCYYGKIKCPFYRYTKKTGGIACIYESFFGYDALLSDGCKICGINLDIEEPYL